MNNFFGNVNTEGTISLLQLNPRLRALYYDATLADYIINNRNNIKSGTSPAKGYGGALILFDVDENGDVIYKYNEKCK